MSPLLGGRLLELVLSVGASELFGACIFGVGLGGRALEACEPRVDSPPSGADEVDEQREVVHPRVTLGEEIAFEPLEPSDCVVEEAADLGDVPRNRKDLRAQAVAHCDADVGRDGGFELGCGGREALDLSTRALERGLDIGRVGATRCGFRDPLLGSLEREGVHGRRGYSQRRMDTALLDYELPTELIAQHPVEPRDTSRLLVYRRDAATIEHRSFAELPELLAGELVVVNDTRVVPARLRLRRGSGGAVEVLLVENLDDGRWEALARPSARLRVGEQVGPVRLVEPLGEGRWIVALEGEPAGEAPLPAYIHEPLADAGRYQTVYANVSGSAAAPTAGLHFTRELVERLDPVRVTLHVGLDTFRPVTGSRLEEHEIHGERYAVDATAWERIVSARRVLAVGTTTVRVLESVMRTGELSGRTMLFITPGFVFERVDALLTNFHLPRSTLLALIMAFVGVEETHRIYREAIAERYRFYSFGDAMVVL
jgi:S-adenosylmethionine:tRNA ribosyltransferase-isomerase